MIHFLNHGRGAIYLHMYCIYSAGASPSYWTELGAMVLRDLEFFRVYKSSGECIFSLGSLPTARYGRGRATINCFHKPLLLFPVLLDTRGGKRAHKDGEAVQTELRNSDDQRESNMSCPFNSNLD